MSVKKVPMKDPIKTYPIPPVAVEARYPYPDKPVKPVGTLATDEPPLRAAPQKQGLQKMSPARGRGPTPTMKSGGKVGSASKRADGIAQRGKTRGKMV